jgi:ribose/xylose/arabinose/galactoside ABC-type transport system permease subunit
MFDFSNLGRFFVVLGLIVAAIGLVLIFAGKIPWIGRLPGDFFFRGRNFSFYFPLTTSILISVILTLILWFFNRR